MIALPNRDGGQKLYKLFGLFSLLFVFFITSLYAESFKEFKKTQAQSFSNFKDKSDVAFNNYLKQQFQEYNSLVTKPFFEKQKPRKTESVRPEKIKSVGPLVHIVVNPKNKQLPKIVAVDNSKKDVEFDFFGESLGFDVDKSIKTAQFYPQNQEGISNFFSVLASSDYEYIIKNIQKTKEKMRLNDWGVYLLVMKLGRTIYETPDRSKLFSWFVFNKLGYDVKVGLAHKHIVMMHYSKKVIYATPSYTFSKRKFYVVSEYAKGSVGRVYTYDKSYPNATKPLDLSMSVLPNFPKKMKRKTLFFKQYDKKYTLPFAYNQNLLDFMNTYPQADYETFFDAPMETTTYDMIAKDIKRYIDGKKASVAMNFVLNFVQNAFVYEVDEEQFGREKVMFAEETLCYNKSDCEDRAILFAYLIKKLFHVGVVGVKYKDHMATALYIPMKGDSVRKGRKRYVIADPTYINANIGMSMPKYKSIRPESFIVVKG